MWKVAVRKSCAVIGGHILLRWNQNLPCKSQDVQWTLSEFLDKARIYFSRKRLKIVALDVLQEFKLTQGIVAIAITALLFCKM